MDGHRYVTTKLNLTPHAREVIDAFCVAEGVTLSAMVEAYVEQLEAQPGGGPNRAVFLQRAREITADRRRRPRP